MSDMRNDDHNLDAAEYVLGTLAPEQARAFAKRLADEPELARAVADWEHRLGTLGEELEPVAPPAHVWQAIADDLGMSRPTGRQDIRPAANDSAMRRWRLTAIAASTAAVVLAGALWLGVGQNTPGFGPEPAYASMIYDQPTGMSWLIHSVGETDRQMAVEALQDYAVPRGKTLRMYIRGPNGQASLVGNLPHAAGHYVMTLDDNAAAHLQRDSQMVVSMEDTGQPAGQPAGQIMWVTPIALRRG